MISEYWDLELLDDLDTSFEYRESELDTDSSEEEKYDIIEHHQKNAFGLFGENNENQSETDSNDEYSDDESNQSLSRSVVDNEYELKEKLKRTKKEKDTIIEKLARMLIVFTKIMQSNYVYRDVFSLTEF